MMNRIVIIGTGNIAYHLLRGFNKLKIKDLSIWGRDKEKQKVLAEKFDCNEISNLSGIDESTQLCIIAVSDSAIKTVAASIPAINGLVCHTSGSTSLSVLDGFFVRNGVFWPLQTLSEGNDIPFQKIPVCVEASTKEDERKLKELANQLTGNSFVTTSEDRMILHLAAVLVSNFSNHLSTIAYKILQEKEILFNVLKPLIAETSDKTQRIDPEKAQTGPAIRNDLIIEKKHLDLLVNHPKIQELYKLFSDSIKKIHLDNN